MPSNLSDDSPVAHPPETSSDRDMEDELDSDTASTPSLADDETPDDTSGVPIRLKLLPGQLHLLQPRVHKIDTNSVYSDIKVNTARPIKLDSPDGDWYFSTLRDGAHLPRPFNAPKICKVTKPSKLMDSVVQTWLENGLLVPNPNLKYAQVIFLEPKPDNKIRPIIDYSPWTKFIIAPHFSLLTAGAAIRKIPLGNLMIKVDLTSGFHQIPLAKSSYKHNGISYTSTKYSLTRLPMVHALAPYLFQRFAEAVLDEINLTLNVDGIAYLNDCYFTQGRRRTFRQPLTL